MFFKDRRRNMWKEKKYMQEKNEERQEIRKRLGIIKHPKKNCLIKPVLFPLVCQKRIGKDFFYKKGDGPLDTCISFFRNANGETVWLNVPYEGFLPEPNIFDIRGVSVSVAGGIERCDCEFMDRLNLCVIVNNCQFLDLPFGAVYHESITVETVKFVYKMFEEQIGHEKYQKIGTTEFKVDDVIFPHFPVKVNKNGIVIEEQQSYEVRVAPTEPATKELFKGYDIFCFLHGILYRPVL
jgi:hypothetical protein